MRTRMIFQVVFLFFAMVAVLLPATHVNAGMCVDNQKVISATKCNALADEAGVPNSIEMAPEGDTEVTKIELQLLDLINDEREKHNLNWLSWNDQLFQAAKNFSKSIASMNVSSDEINDASSIGAWIETVGEDENVATAVIVTERAGAQEVFDGLMNNDRQRAALLNASHCEVGIGYVVDERSNRVHYWTLNLLGTQRSVNDGSQVDLKAEFDSPEIRGVRGRSSDICNYLKAEYNRIFMQLQIAQVQLAVLDAMAFSDKSMRRKVLKTIRNLKMKRNKLGRLIANNC